jgi:hypothetical protein
VTDDELKSLFSGLRQEMAATLRHETAALRHEMVAMLAETRQSLSGDIAGVRHEIAAVREENIAMHAQTRRHFDVALEAARHETQLVAERVGGLTERINDLDVKFTEIATDLDRRVVRLEIASSKR